MRICLTTWGFPTPYCKSINGIAVYTARTAKAMAQLGHDVTVVTTHADGMPDSYTTDEGVRIFQSPIGNVHWYLHKSRLVSVASVRYIKIWEIGKALSRMAIRLSQKKPFDIIEGGPPSAWLYPELRKLKNTEIVMTLHGSKGLHHHEFPARLSIFDRFWCFAERKAAQAADLLVAPSQYVANFYRREYQRSPVVIALPAEQVRKKDPPASPVKILTLAAISPGKGSEIILEASKVLLSKYPDIQISLVAAEGKPEFERLLHACAPGQIKILPWLPPEKYTNELLDSHIFLSASLFETFGLSVAEAMACGKVILTSDIPAHKELVGESERGLLFKQGDMVDFLEKIDCLITQPDLIQKFGKKAAEWAAINLNPIELTRQRLIHYSSL